MDTHDVNFMVNYRNMFWDIGKSCLFIRPNYMKINLDELNAILAVTSTIQSNLIYLLSR